MNVQTSAHGHWPCSHLRQGGSLLRCSRLNVCRSRRLTSKADLIQKQQQLRVAGPRVRAVGDGLVSHLACMDCSLSEGRLFAERRFCVDLITKQRMQQTNNPRLLTHCQ